VEALAHKIVLNAKDPKRLPQKMIVCYEDNPNHPDDMMREVLIQAALGHFSSHSAKMWRIGTDTLRVFKLSSRSVTNRLAERAARKGLRCAAMTITPNRSSQIEDGDAMADNDDEVIFGSAHASADAVPVWILGPEDTVKLDAVVRLDVTDGDHTIKSMELL